MAIHVFGAIDLGSYEISLTIYEVSRNKGIRKIDTLTRRVDLGSDTYSTGKISHAHVQQVGRILKEFRKVMDSYQVEDYKCYGTSAIREMTNTSLVLGQWETMSGIHVDVVSNSEQRFLDYKSVAFRGEAFDKFLSESTAIVDIGGGSIQISLFAGQRLYCTQNMEIGVLRVHDAVSAIDARSSQYDELIAEIAGSQIDTFVKLYVGKAHIKNIILIDDYINELAMKRGVEYIQTADFDRLLKGAEETGTARFAEYLGVETDSIPLVRVSAAIISLIIRAFGAEQLWTPGVTLCDGIAYEYAEKRKILTTSHDFEADILACAHSISKRYMGSEMRSSTLEGIAVKIFDATKKVHGLTKRDCLLLRIATILHDCGKYISMVNLAECSYNIIMSTEIIGLSHREREIVANVVRYNHDDFVYFEEQETASDLDEKSYITITKLTAILRVANGLDRSHKRKFQDIRITVKDDVMYITNRTPYDISLERGLFEERAAFFEEVMGLTPVIRQAKDKQ